MKAVPKPKVPKAVIVVGRLRWNLGWRRLRWYTRIRLSRNRLARVYYNTSNYKDTPIIFILFFCYYFQEEIEPNATHTRAQSGGR